MANDEQIEYWNAEAAARWVESQELLDRQLAPITDALIEAAAIAPGIAVLDVGCGCGETSVLASQRVGSGGTTLGVDISQPMLARATERAQAEGLTWLSFEQGDAQTHAFPMAAFDLAMSRFGVMFFEDTAAAFANVRKALKPGGRLVFVCWRPLMENPWMTIPLMAVKGILELPPAPDPNEPGPFALGDGARLRGFLEAAGFSDIEIKPFDTKMSVGAGAELEESVDFFFKIGPLSRLLAEADSATRDKVRDVLRTTLAPFNSDAGVAMDAATWVVSARNG